MNTRGRRSLIHVRPKRKSSSFHDSFKNWNREDALKALAIEQEYELNKMETPTLLLQFPDPELNRDIVKQFSPDIENVHFQLPSAARSCIVHLKKDANVLNVIENISKIPFGTGFVSANIKPTNPIIKSCPTEVDPYALYIGNLPNTLTVAALKEYLPNAERIELGFAQRMKSTRYAFVRYNSVDKAIEAFKNIVNDTFETRSLIVRFRRLKSTISSSDSREPLSKRLTTDSNIDLERNSGKEYQNDVIETSSFRVNSNRRADEPVSLTNISSKTSTSIDQKPDQENQTLQNTSCSNVAIKEERCSDEESLSWFNLMTENNFHNIENNINETPFEYMEFDNDDNWSNLRRSHCVEKKPEISNINTEAKKVNNVVEPPNAHNCLLQELITERRQVRKVERIESERDELDDIFEQMNSDLEDD